MTLDFSEKSNNHTKITISEAKPVSESEDEEIKSLLNPINDDNDHAIESHRRAAIARAKFNTIQKDTFAFSLVKIWVALAEALAPVFAFFAKKSNTPASKKNNK